jgi:hypothetical protein
LREHQPEALYLAVLCVLGWVGGTDTERILLLAAPVVYVLIGRALEDCSWLWRSWGVLALLAVSQCLSQRWLWPIPQPVNQREEAFLLLTALGPSARYGALWSNFAHYDEALILLIEYTVLAAALLWAFRRAEGRSRPT